MSIAVDEFHSSALLLSIFYWMRKLARKAGDVGFLKLYSDTVDEYSAADESKKAEMKGELNSFKSKWSNMKMEMDGELTPQAFDKLDKEYDKITTKYASLAGLS
jgi:hypothetical protein